MPGPELPGADETWVALMLDRACVRGYLTAVLEEAVSLAGEWIGGAGWWCGLVMLVSSDGW